MQIHPTPDPLSSLGAPSLAAAVRALVVADDPLVRGAFVSRLGALAVGEVRSTDDLVAAVDRTTANLVLWDLGPDEVDDDEDRMPALGEIDQPVVLLSPPGGSASAALARGAAAVLLRDTPAAALRSALETVLCGLVVVDPELLAAGWPEPPPLEPELPPEATLPLQPLTPREAEVLQLLGVGLSNKQIAEHLGISAHTVKFHIAAILEKLDAGSRTEAVVRAVQLGLVMV